MPLRTTNRRLGNRDFPARYTMEPEVTYGLDHDDRPTVVIIGGVPRRAPGLAFVSVGALKPLRADLDEAIDLMTLAEREECRQ